MTCRYCEVQNKMFGNPTTDAKWGGGVMQLSMTATVPRTRDYIMLENEEIVIPAILTMTNVLTKS